MEIGSTTQVLGHKPTFSLPGLYLQGEHHNADFLLVIGELGVPHVVKTTNALDSHPHFEPPSHLPFNWDQIILHQLWQVPQKALFLTQTIKELSNFVLGKTLTAGKYSSLNLVKILKPPPLNLVSSPYRDHDKCPPKCYSPMKNLEKNSCRPQNIEMKSMSYHGLL